MAASVVLTTMIFVKDIERMREFYERGFALAVDQGATTDGYVVLGAPGVRLSLHRLPPAVAERLVIVDPPEPRGDSAIKPIFAVSDLDGTRGALERLGAHLFETVTDDSVDGLDPEGNVFRLERAS